jgi:hypothetical protein
MAKVICLVPLKQAAHLLGCLPSFSRPSPKRPGVGIHLQTDHFHEVLYPLGISMHGVAVIDEQARAFRAKHSA